MVYRTICYAKSLLHFVCFYACWIMALFSICHILWYQFFFILWFYVYIRLWPHSKFVRLYAVIYLFIFSCMYVLGYGSIFYLYVYKCVPFFPCWILYNMVIFYYGVIFFTFNNGLFSHIFYSISLHALFAFVCLWFHYTCLNPILSLYFVDFSFIKPIIDCQYYLEKNTVTILSFFM